MVGCAVRGDAHSAVREAGAENLPGGGAVNHMYYGDNLGVLHERIKDASVDLICLNPPFNSGASYSVLCNGVARNSVEQIEPFEDTRHGTEAAPEVRRLPVDAMTWTVFDHNSATGSPPSACRWIAMICAFVSLLVFIQNFLVHLG